jgi:hypothetical protein
MLNFNSKKAKFHNLPTFKSIAYFCPTLVMKKSSLLLTSAGMLFIALGIGCDKIEPPFTELNVATGLDTVVFPEETNPIRRVLVEDYTGHTCGNCPSAATIAHELHDQYQEKLVVMALHVSEQFAAPLNDGTGEFTYDFRTSEGTEIDNYFGCSNAGLPRGMVNRRSFGGSKLLDRFDWGSAVAEIINQEPIVNIQVKPYLTQTDSVVAYVKCTFLNDLPEAYSIAVYAIEDSIINWQKDYSLPPPKTIENYVHTHVLRDAFVGAFGESIGTTGFKANDVVKKGYAIKRGSDWEPKNLKVVAFVYNTSTEEVLQVGESSVIIK